MTYFLFSTFASSKGTNNVPDGDANLSLTIINREMRMMITSKCKRRVRLVEQDLCEDQRMNMGAEYTMKRLKNKLSSELVDMLVMQLLGFNEVIQEEIADNLELYVRNHEVHTTGCPSVDYVLDVCYMWIAAELGEV